MAAVELLAGLLIVVMVLFDVFQSVVVSRFTSRSLRLSPFLIRGTWRMWRGMGLRMRLGPRRENFLAAFGPLTLLITLLAWALLLVLGYGLALHALRSQIQPPAVSFGGALYLAALSLTTLGFVDQAPAGAAARIIVLAATGSGLAVVALVLSLLFNLHEAFQRRERSVLLLDARAGAPPSGVTLIETYVRLGMLEELPAWFAAWEAWAADVLESHMAYRQLLYFRSSHVGESWVSALGAVLDAATLMLTTVDGGRQGGAELLSRIGVHAVLDLSDWCRLGCDEEVGVERQEWEEARRRLAAVGCPLQDAETAWREFARRRSEYAGPLNALAQYFAAPPALWIGGPPVPPHRPKQRRSSDPERRLAVATRCTHLDQIRDVTPSADGCEECLAIGDSWVHLRLCLTCGHVGCCDSSKNKHATKHFHATRHPIIQSLEPGEEWGWCYADELMLDFA